MKPGNRRRPVACPKLSFWQQTKHGIPAILLSNSSCGDCKALLGQMRYADSPVGSGSTPVWVCLENLQREEPRRIPESPEMVPLAVGEPRALPLSDPKVSYNMG